MSNKLINYNKINLIFSQHVVVHVPYNIHTVHHHHVEKIPIIKHVPIYKHIHVPVYKEVHVPVHVPVHSGWSSGHGAWSNGGGWW